MFSKSINENHSQQPTPTLVRAAIFPKASGIEGNPSFCRLGQRRWTSRLSGCQRTYIWGVVGLRNKSSSASHGTYSKDIVRSLLLDVHFFLLARYLDNKSVLNPCCGCGESKRFVQYARYRNVFHICRAKYSSHSTD